MKTKFAVALMKGESETILGVFETKEEADFFGTKNRLPREAGLHYCFSTRFSGKRPVGKSIHVYNYYNV